MQVTTFRTLELAISFHTACQRVEAKAYVRDQLERATFGAVLNLQEGAARPTRKDQKRFYAMAYASIRESQVILRILGLAELFAQADTLGAHAYRLLKH